MEISISYNKVFVGTPFRIVADTVKNSPGTWDSEKVSIFRDGKLIGEYMRNYTNGVNTFYPFQLEGEWYALYSAQYTELRAMRLGQDHIEDWCGTQQLKNAFCPLELYVPRYNVMTDSYTSGTDELRQFEYSVVDSTVTADEFIADSTSANCKETTYCDFGFVAGCLWGDDSTAKLRYIDLAKIVNKELHVTEKFGYWEIPDRMTLQQAVDMSHWEPAHNWISLARVEHINLKTDERC